MRTALGAIIRVVMVPLEKGVCAHVAMVATVSKSVKSRFIG